MTQTEKKRPRILSGMRPTGRLHLGNLVGALQNWIKLQDQYDCYYFVADWHMLTTEYANPSDLQSNIREMVTDWLAVGLDPQKATFFVQSRLPEHAELFLILSMLTPLGWLERVPTYKEQLENIKDRDIHTFGFLGYPVLQAADILMYKANFVPVGEDQVPHVELTREMARRFNALHPQIDPNLVQVKGLKSLFEYVQKWDQNVRMEIGSLSEAIDRSSAEERRRLWELRIALDLPLGGIFVEPDALLTSTPRLRGTDGRKMSKSYDNAIYLSDAPEVVSKKVAGMMTDPARKRRYDPGDPEKCPVFDHHKIFSPPDVIERVDRECRTAELGCVDCKKLMAEHLNRFLAPVQERRKAYEQEPQKVWNILEEGTGKARHVAQSTMAEVRAAVKLT